MGSEARFTRRSNQDKDDKWVEVNDDIACKKVGHAPRRGMSDQGKKTLQSVHMQQQQQYTQG